MLAENKLFKDQNSSQTLHKKKKLEISGVVGVCFHFAPVKAILQSHPVWPIGGDH